MRKLNLAVIDHIIAPVFWKTLKLHFDLRQVKKRSKQ